MVLRTALSYKVGGYGDIKKELRPPEEKDYKKAMRVLSDFGIDFKSDNEQVQKLIAEMRSFETVGQLLNWTSRTSKNLAV